MSGWRDAAQRNDGNGCGFQAERVRVIRTSDCTARDWLVVYTNTFSSIQLPVLKVTYDSLYSRFPYHSGTESSQFGTETGAWTGYLERNQSKHVLAESLRVAFS